MNTKRHLRWSLKVMMTASCVHSSTETFVKELPITSTALTGSGPVPLHQLDRRPTTSVHREARGPLQKITFPAHGGIFSSSSSVFLLNSAIHHCSAEMASGKALIKNRAG